MKNGVVFLPLLLVTAISLSACGLPRPQSDGAASATSAAATVSTAQEAEKAGDWQVAAGQWASILDKDPGNRDALVFFARDMRLAGQCGQAFEKVSHFVAAHPNDAGLGLELAKCHLSSGRPEAGEILARGVVEGHQDMSEAHTVLGVALDRMGLSAEAVVEHTKAAQLAPLSATAHSNLALALALNGDLPGALETARRSITMPGADIRVRQNLAFLEALNGNADRAVAMVAQDLPPGSAESDIALYKKIAARVGR